MQFTLFQLQVCLFLIFFNFESTQALPAPSNRDSLKVVIVSPSDGSRQLNFPATPNSFAPRTHFCGQPLHSNSTQDAISKALVSKKASKLNALKLELQSKGFGTAHTNLILTAKMKPISVAFHILYDEQTGAGNVTDEAVADQVQVLNQDYGPYGFEFNLVNTTRTGNSTLFNQGSPGSSTETEMKSLLHQGDASTLNVYSVSFSDSLLGYSTWPWDYEDDSTNDGVVFLYSTIPGGDAQDYNLGKTLTHESGHWLGLYHTFQGGCNGEGDDVDDTPPQSIPTSGCPANKDTCKSDNLPDPIHNYMDYSVDECLTEFTQGQALRMSAITSEYRGL